MTETCGHDTFELDPQVNVTEGDAPFTFVEVRVRCAQCQLMFHWRGFNSGHPNPREATVSADGYKLYAPIAAGPGAVVGLLSAVGLADRIVNPEDEPRGGRPA